jgi:hypothetical protein
MVIYGRVRKKGVRFPHEVENTLQTVVPNVFSAACLSVSRLYMQSVLDLVAGNGITVFISSI